MVAAGVSTSTLCDSRRLTHADGLVNRRTETETDTNAMAKLGEHDTLLGGGVGGRREPYWRRLLSIPPAILPVALLSFGGPPAHLALAHDHFVCASARCRS